ncbi:MULTISPECIES: hypothetical protein [unclassified Arcicella]|uniref:hypothetical protein n=1 Tax=unclassified Arcicella TaxID=2644986 RepID=UPI0028620F0F|nr:MULTISPECIES: hypothetical protein [unclassified Arcicella]MDR6564996.1 hypothetical protein [Arcicella sp. BE51]MDR6814825.1 hypothetical protein [Arcicella sp. BE140]MDR6826271.1 hypothetical protein [Arcicella sp. BE139]
MKNELNDNFIRALERVEKIKSKYPGPESNGNNNIINFLLLYLEHIRRNVIWVVEIEKLKGVEINQVRNLDFANMINNEWDLDNESYGKILKSSYKSILIHYLNFELHKEEFPKLFFTLPNPYEPIIVFFEKGYCYRYEHGEVNLGDFVIKNLQKRFYVNMKPIIQLEERDFQKEDKQFSLNNIEYIKNLVNETGIRIDCLF